MKTKNLKILILIALLTSVSLFSQDLQPKKIVYDNEEGLFISFSLMDSISYKLIDRKSILKENLSLGDLLLILQAKNDQLLEKSQALERTVDNWRVLYVKSEAQKAQFYEALESQREITTNVKIKARRNGLILFGGGVSVGIAAFLIFGN